MSPAPNSVCNRRATELVAPPRLVRYFDSPFKPLPQPLPEASGRGANAREFEFFARILINYTYIYIYRSRRILPPIAMGGPRGVGRDAKTVGATYHVARAQLRMQSTGGRRSVPTRLTQTTRPLPRPSRRLASKLTSVPLCLCGKRCSANMLNSGAQALRGRRQIAGCNPARAGMTRPPPADCPAPLEPDPANSKFLRFHARCSG